MGHTPAQSCWATGGQEVPVLVHLYQELANVGCRTHIKGGQHVHPKCVVY